MKTGSQHLGEKVDGVAAHAVVGPVVFLDENARMIGRFKVARFVLVEREASGAKQGQERRLSGRPDLLFAPARLGGGAACSVRIGAGHHVGLVSSGVE